MLVHLDGSLVPAASAHISVFDRGFLFGDGVYEGLRAFGGWVRNAEDHAARMQQGLDEAGIAWDASRLADLSAELLRANRLSDAFLYWQITRGTPRPGDPLRARVPEPGITPTVFGYCTPMPGVDALTEPTTCSARTLPDVRWGRGHVKSVSLMANVMAALEARAAGADEALLVRGGWLSESCATNVFVVTADGSLCTPPVGDVSILAGVTRKMMLQLCPHAEVRMIAETELHAAREIFLVGTMTSVRSVVALDGRPVGDGAPGPVARDVLRRYAEAIRARAQTGTIVR